MPDLPFRSTGDPESPPQTTTPPSETVHEIHSLKSHRFNKIFLSGGPFTVKLYRNVNPNETYQSVDVEAEPSIQRFISINADQPDLLAVRMIESLSITNRTNITIFITYNELNELHIDGLIHIHCLNQIQTNALVVHNRGTGSMKLKLHVNSLDAYFHSIGRVKMCGQVTEQASLKSLGVGDVDCRKLFTKRIDVVSSGIGNIYVSATDEIRITLSGIGTVYYSGPLMHQVKTGLGNIMRMQDASFTTADRLINASLD